MTVSAPAVVGPIRLFLLQPTVIFRATVNQASFTYPISEVTFDNVTVGTYTDITVGMTVVFSSSIGEADRGRSRIRRPATSDTLYFGRSSIGTHDGEVNLDDDIYIEVWNDYRIWPKIPTMPVMDGVDLEIYKDGEISVGDNTTYPPPIANCGPGFAGTIDPVTKVVTVNFDATDSLPIADGATITGYQWFMYDGTITVGTSTDAEITATFPAGFRWIALTVVDSNAKSHTARAPIFARDPDNDVTISDFANLDFEITPKGQEVRFSIYEDILPSAYPDGTLVMIWDDSISPNADREGMLFIGWHHTDPARISAGKFYLEREVIFECVDAAGKLDTLPGFPQILADDDTRNPAEEPSITWSYMVNPTVKKYIHYLLYWHSTALTLSDLRFHGAYIDMPFVALQSDGMSLFSQVANRVQQLTPDHVFTCRRRGELAVWPDPMLIDPVERTEASQGEILEKDYYEISYTHQRNPRVYWLRGGAIISQDTPVYNEDGSLNIPTVFCIAPGEAPGIGVSQKEENERLAASQEDLNATIGFQYARLNAPQSHFTVNLSTSKDHGFEPADLEWVWLELRYEQAAQRRLHFLTMAGTIPVYQERGLIHRISMNHRTEREGLIREISLEWERETTGPPAVTVIPPDVEPADDYDPTPYIPPIPPELPAGDMNSGLYSDPSLMVAVMDNGYIYRTSNFNVSSPTWSGFNTGITAPVLSFVVDPFSPGYVGGGDAINGWVVNHTGIYRLTDMFAATPGVTLQHTFAVSTAFEIGGPTMRARTINASFGRYFASEEDNPWLMVVSNYRNTSGHEGVWAIYSIDAGQTWSDEVQITPHHGVGTLNNDWDIMADNFEHPAVYLSPKQWGRAYVSAYKTSFWTDGELYTQGAAYVYETSDWGASWSIYANEALFTNRILANCIHVPWPDNADEQLVYYGQGSGRLTQSGARYMNLKRAQGETITDISPTVDGDPVGPAPGNFAIRSYDNDRSYMSLVGLYALQGTTNDYIAPFVSDDGGDTWTQLETAVLASGTSAHVREMAFAGDNPNVLFLWGRAGAGGSVPYFKYSTDFGATLSVKTGTGLSSPSGQKRILGIAGGPLT